MDHPSYDSANAGVRYAVSLAAAEWWVAQGLNERAEETDGGAHAGAFVRQPRNTHEALALLPSSPVGSDLVGLYMYVLSGRMESTKPEEERPCDTLLLTLLKPVIDAAALPGSEEAIADSIRKSAGALRRAIEGAPPSRRADAFVRTQRHVESLAATVSSAPNVAKEELERAMESEGEMRRGRIGLIADSEAARAASTRATDENLVFRNALRRLQRGTLTPANLLAFLGSASQTTPSLGPFVRTLTKQ